MQECTKHTAEQVLDAIARAHTKAGVARLLGCSRKPVHSYAKRWSTVAAAFEDERRGLVDLAEDGLREALENKEPWAVTFTLRTLGKDEGYSERHEVTGANGGPVQTTITEMVVQLPPEDSEGE